MGNFNVRNIKNNIRRISQSNLSNNQYHNEDYTRNSKRYDDVITENKETKKENNMTTFEKIQQANSILSSTEIPTKVKRVKKDKGLIERTESSKIVLTEDNKELLID